MAAAVGPSLPPKPGQQQQQERRGAAALPPRPPKPAPKPQAPQGHGQGQGHLPLRLASKPLPLPPKPSAGIAGAAPPPLPDKDVGAPPALPAKDAAAPPALPAKDAAAPRLPTKDAAAPPALPAKDAGAPPLPSKDASAPPLPSKDAAPARRPAAAPFSRPAFLADCSALRPKPAPPPLSAAPAPPLPTKDTTAPRRASAADSAAGAPPAADGVEIDFPFSIAGVRVERVAPDGSKGDRTLMALTLALAAGARDDGAPSVAVVGDGVVLAHLNSEKPALCFREGRYLFQSPKGVFFYVRLPRVEPDPDAAAVPGALSRAGFAVGPVIAENAVLLTVLRAYSGFVEMEAGSVDTRAVGSRETRPFRRAVALFDFEPASPDEVGFRAGDKIVVFEWSGDWWSGEVWSDEERRWIEGCFPANRVQLKETSREAQVASTVLKRTGSGMAMTGRYAGRGAVRGAQLLGSGMKRGTDEYKKRSAPADSRRAHQPLSDADDAATARKASGAFLEGSRKAVYGLKRGTDSLGHGISNQVKKTGAYKTHQEKSKYNDPDSLAKSGFAAASGAVSGVGSTVRGVKDGVVVTAESVRDTTVAVVEHKKGAAAAQGTKDSFDAVGSTTVGVFNVAETMAVVVKTPVLVGKVGIAGVVGDPTERMVFGHAWMTGRVELQDWKLHSRWLPKVVELRTFAVVHFDPTNLRRVSGFIDIDASREIKLLPAAESSSAGGRPFSVFLRQRDRNYVFACSSAEEAKRWVGALCTLRRFVQSKEYK